jgi:hypothetical protein
VSATGATATGVGGSGLAVIVARCALLFEHAATASAAA